MYSILILNCGIGYTISGIFPFGFRERKTQIKREQKRETQSKRKTIINTTKNVFAHKGRLMIIKRERGRIISMLEA